MPYADKENVSAVIAGHLSGREIGHSIVDNPSGKLPYTVAYNASDYNGDIDNFTGATNAEAWLSDFTEGLMLDHRHFDSAVHYAALRLWLRAQLHHLCHGRPRHQQHRLEPDRLTRRRGQEPAPGGNPWLWDVAAQEWKIPSGTFTFLAGSSPLDLPPEPNATAALRSSHVAALIGSGEVGKCFPECRQGCRP